MCVVEVGGNGGVMCVAKVGVSAAWVRAAMFPPHPLLLCLPRHPPVTLGPAPLRLGGARLLMEHQSPAPALIPGAYLAWGAYRSLPEGIPMIWNVHDWGICWDEENQKVGGHAPPSTPRLGGRVHRPPGRHARNSTCRAGTPACRLGLGARREASPRCLPSDPTPGLPWGVQDGTRVGCPAPVFSPIRRELQHYDVLM